MGLFVEDAWGLFDVFVSLEDHLEETVDGFVDKSFIELAFFDGLEDFRVGLAARGWHFEVAGSF